MNKAEALFVAEHNASGSLQEYDKAFQIYERPFVSDLFIAAQIAFYSHDTMAMKRYLQLCFNRGMTFTVMHAPKLFKPIFTDTLFLSQLQSLYDQRKVKPVDSSLHDSIYMHFYREQMIKRTLRPGVNFDKMHAIEKENVTFFNTFLERGQFPSEQLIGLHTEDALDRFFSEYKLESFRQAPPKSFTSGNVTMSNIEIIPDDYDLCNLTALYSYLHYPCGFIERKEQFYKAVENGYLHMKDYCMMEEWAAQTNGNPNYNHDCENNVLPYYYNIYWSLRVNEPELIKKVEQHRKENHLQTYSVDKMKMTLQEEDGFQFFFGFLRMR